MILRPLALEDEAEALIAHSELAKDDFEFLLGYEPGMPWSNYLEQLKRESIGLNLPEDRVQATFLIAEDAGNLVGRSSIRHTLNDFLFNYVGHIGYGVRPEFRRRGFASQIMTRSLNLIFEFGVNRVLMTCSDDNIGSAKIIEAHGGVLENKVEFKGVAKRRYWISNLSEESK